MAIYHFSGTIIARSQGRSSIAASAYRAGEKLVDEQLGLTYDYSKKQDVVHSEILLPDNAPETLKDRQTLWNTVEKTEKRKDAQLAREFTISLPRELTIEQNKTLIVEFVQSEFVDKGMIADICLHNDLMPDGERQPHAHVMLTLREVSKEGFEQKVRQWNDKANLLAWREAWANTANRHLALQGFDKQIDHRSYAEQGIELEPQHKIGASIAKDHMARLADHQRIARENGNCLFENPDIALDALTRQQSTFTHQDLARFINRHTETADQFKQVYDKVLASPALVQLGLDNQGKQRLSTKEMLAIESSMLQKAALLDSRLHHGVSEQTKATVIRSRTLSQEQETALHYLTKAGDLKSLVGYAGTGKSYVLGATKEAWEQSGYRVRGAALSGIAAKNLSDSSGIESRTIASLFYRLDKGMDALTAKDVLVIDEAGMLGSRTMERLVRETQACGAKLVLVGDWQQLQAIEAGASFRAIAETHQYGELTTIRRQSIDWQVTASLDLAAGQVEKALETYRNHDHVHTFKDQAEAKAQLIDLWNDARISNACESQIILAYTRRDVQELNELARTQKRRDGELGKDVAVECERGLRHFAVNDRVYFFKREDSLAVINGSLGTVRTIHEKTGLMTVELDAERAGEKPRCITVNPSTYNHLDHGYAATVYKAQGVTVDRAYVLPSKHYDAHSTYVAMTRHRKSCDVFVSREAFPQDKVLIDCLARNRAKDVTLDYTVMDKEFARQRAIHADKEPTTDKDRQAIEQLTRNYLHDKGASNLQKQLDTFDREFKQTPTYNKLAREQITKERNAEILRRHTPNKQSEQPIRREEKQQEKTMESRVLEKGEIGD